MATGDAIRPKIEHSLASLASRAAIELDDLFRGRETFPVMTKRLVDTLTEEFPNFQEEIGGGRRVKLTNVLVMKRAIGDSRLYAPMKHRDDVFSTTQEILGTLRRIVEDPFSFQADSSDLEKMRTLCISLSKQAGAAGSSSEEDEHRHSRS